MAPNLAFHIWRRYEWADGNETQKVERYATAIIESVPFVGAGNVNNFHHPSRDIVHETNR